MNKLLAVIMSAVIALGMVIHPQAAGSVTITQDSEEKSGNTNINYSAEETYTVVFPASVTFTDSEKAIERGLQVSNVLINEGSSLNVYVSSLNNFKMRNGEGYIDYKLMINYNGNPEEYDYRILSIDAGEGGGVAILYFVTELNKDNTKYAGTYTDTLTFTVSVE